MSPVSCGSEIVRDCFGVACCSLVFAVKLGGCLGDVVTWWWQRRDLRQG